MLTIQSTMMSDKYIQPVAIRAALNIGADLLVVSTLLLLLLKVNFDENAMRIIVGLIDINGLIILYGVAGAALVIYSNVWILRRFWPIFQAHLSGGFWTPINQRDISMNSIYKILVLLLNNIVVILNKPKYLPRPLVLD